MKKRMFILAAFAALAVSCQTVEIPPEEATPVASEGGYSFDFNVSGGGFGPVTKADATVGWTRGESIFVFFQPDGEGILDSYLSLTYDGSKFVQGGSSVRYGVLGEGGRLSAVYIPYLKGGVKPVYGEGGWTINAGDVYYSCATGVSYEVDGETVSAAIDMYIPDGYVQFAVPATKAKEGDELSCNMVDAYSCVTLGTDLKFSETAVEGKKMTGHKDGDKVYFWGKKNAVTAEKCEITLASSVTGGNLGKSIEPSKVIKNCAYNLTFPGYRFELKSASDATLSFDNTDVSSATKNVPIISKEILEGSPEKDVEWQIKSVRVGNASPETVNAKQFNDICGLSAAINGSNLSVSGSARTGWNPSTHDFWVNSTVRTDHLDWSPEDWSGNTRNNPIDLSKFDFHTETVTGTMTTANCYVIRHAGTYKLPLVYGNAVVNNEENYCSYYPNHYKDIEGGDSEDNYRLVHFKNHLDNDITSAFIENNEGCGGEDLKCAIIWQEQAEMIVNTPQSFKLTGQIIGGEYTKDNVRYLQFTIDQDKICQNNALICIYKDIDAEGHTANKYDEGEAVWSWHIMTTNDPALILGAIPVLNASGIRYDFFPLSAIGWIDGERFDGNEDTKILLEQEGSGLQLEISVQLLPSVGEAHGGTLYQGGRKDPVFSPSLSVSHLNVREYWSDQGRAPVSGLYLDHIGRVTFGESVANPASVVFNGSSTSAPRWMVDIKNNLWTGKSVRSVVSHDKEIIDKNETIIKTVYDPSPVGYMVPVDGAVSGFIGDFTMAWNAVGTYQSGLRYKTGFGDNTIFFYNNNGSWNYNKGGCDSYWTCIASNNSGIAFISYAQFKGSGRNYPPRLHLGGLVATENSICWIRPVKE